jgi:hypothetical protein
MDEYQHQWTSVIVYNNPGIRNSRSIATTEDIPIKPGESKNFTINPNTVLAWEKGRLEKGYRLPTKVKIEFQDLNFGDGTGLLGDKAAPYPKLSPKRPNFITSHRRARAVRACG